MIKPENTNSEFELGGINHVALVCADMAKTVDFYTGVLGMPLVKSLDLPGGMGQHFFFDAGNGDCVAFFWFAEAPDGVPGVSAPAAIPGIGEIISAVGSLNHLAFHVPAESSTNTGSASRTRVYGSVRCSTTTRARPRCRPPFTRECTCARSTSRIRTASRSNSPAGPSNSPTVTR